MTCQRLNHYLTSEYYIRSSKLFSASSYQTVKLATTHVVAPATARARTGPADHHRRRSTTRRTAPMMIMQPFRHLARRFVSSVTADSAAAVYGGGGRTKEAAARPVTLATLHGKHRHGEPITMITAYDYPSAVHVDSAGIDIILVGDSGAMTVHGHDNTLPISMDIMLQHCRAVARGARRPFLVGDLPFGSYESSTAQAVDSAVRVLKEGGGMDAIKLEGGAPSRIGAAKAIVEAGIAVMGHIGLTPQAVSALGGFRAQGRTVDGAVQVVEAALALQQAGCFAVVLECVPSPVAAAVTSALQIPTIGIGAGPLCSGQVLVYHDLLGMFQDPRNAKVSPKFCKQYGNIGAAVREALSEYKQEVEAHCFPGPVHTPYKIAEEDAEAFANALEKMGLSAAADAAAAAAGVGNQEEETVEIPLKGKVYA